MIYWTQLWTGFFVINLWSLCAELTRNNPIVMSWYDRLWPTHWASAGWWTRRSGRQPWRLASSYLPRQRKSPWSRSIDRIRCRQSNDGSRPRWPPTGTWWQRRPDQSQPGSHSAAPEASCASSACRPWWVPAGSLQWTEWLTPRGRQTGGHGDREKDGELTKTIGGFQCSHFSSW